MIDGRRTTALWLRTLGHRDEDNDEAARDRLRSALDTCRTKAAQLTSRIAASMPGLTIHDVSHLDALWEVADTIAGPDYPITPLEAFIFGAAVLVHDAALCFEAYTGGLDEVRRTEEWRDAYALEKRRTSSEADSTIEHAADFAALRALHAKQAEDLACRGWGSGEHTVHLIDDEGLRSHFGHLIGKIGASHHWDIEQVQARLARQSNPIPDFPAAWTISPIKIACLLRCADAGHLDARRAPDFLYALARRSGASGEHWAAQRWLSRAAYDASDTTGQTLMITSTRAFKIDDADAWWLAYDSIDLFERELKSVDGVLADLSTSENLRFKARGITGVGSPQGMAECLPTAGWKPVAAPLHISNVQQIVANLGGKQLYGEGEHLLEVALRELLQNANDAIAARSAYEGRRRGAITVRLFEDPANTGSFVELEVVDDGIGMSRRVLESVLLDFGTSFWASDLIKSEFPGLAGSAFRAAGRFGLGFYSIFGIADRVHVVSRRYDRGLDDVHQVVFRNGISLRPLFIPGAPPSYDSATTTCVRLHLKTALNEQIPLRKNWLHDEHLEVGIADFIARLAVGLESPVVLERSGERRQIHPGLDQAIQHPEEWLRQLSFAASRKDPELDAHIARNASRLRRLLDHGRCVGFAAVTTSSPGGHLSLSTVDGLGSQKSGDDFIGFIDHHPRSARRDAGAWKATDEERERWAKEQLAILLETPLSAIEKYVASRSLCAFGVDSVGLLMIPIWREGAIVFLSLAELTAFLRHGNIAMLRWDHLSNQAAWHTHLRVFRDLLVWSPIGGGRYNNLEIDTTQPKDALSFAGCIHRALLSQGESPLWTVEEKAAVDAAGMTLDAVILALGG